MKKAKIFLSILIVFIFISVTLAIKAKLPSERLFITQGQMNYSFTTIIGGPVYTTTVQGCITTSRWLTPTGPLLVTTYTSSINPSTVTGFFNGNTATTTYPICLSILNTRTTAIEF